MSSSSFRRVLAALVLGLILAGPWAFAAEPRSRTQVQTGKPAAQEAQGGFEWVLRIFAIFSSKARASADPNGRLGNLSVTGTAALCDNGGTIDPNGRCASGH